MFCLLPAHVLMWDRMENMNSFKCGIKRERAQMIYIEYNNKSYIRANWHICSRAFLNHWIYFCSIFNQKSHRISFSTAKVINNEKTRAITYIYFLCIQIIILDFRISVVGVRRTYMAHRSNANLIIEWINKCSKWIGNQYVGV